MGELHVKFASRFTLFIMAVTLLSNCATYTYVRYVSEQRYRSRPREYDIELLAEDDPGRACKELVLIRIHIEHSKSPWVQEERYQRSLERMQRFARQLGGDAIVGFQRAVEIVPTIFQGSDWGNVYTPPYIRSSSYRMEYRYSYRGPGRAFGHVRVVDPSFYSSLNRTVISGIVVRYIDEAPYR